MYKHETEVADARKRIDEQHEEMSELYDLQDLIDQYTRKTSLEVHGIPESAYSLTEEVVLKLADALKFPVQSEDIEISHKLSSEGMKPIIVKICKS